MRKKAPAAGPASTASLAANTDGRFGGALRRPKRLPAAANVASENGKRQRSGRRSRRAGSRREAARWKRKRDRIRNSAPNTLWGKSLGRAQVS